MFKIALRKAAKEKQKNKKQREKQNTKKKMPDSSSKISIIILNVKDTNISIKRQRLIEWIDKYDNYMQSTRKSLQI